MKQLLFLLSIVILTLSTTTSNTSIPFCSPENLKLVDGSSGEWFLSPDGSFSYQFPHCKLRKFTRKQAAKCLKGSHLVFIGDSITRYLYLSLTSLFAVGEWPAPFSQIFHKNEPPSILCEKDWNEWSLFFHRTNDVLTSRKAQTYEVCDCSRENNFHVENRHLRYHPPESDLDDKENDVRISYIYWLGTPEFSMFGHKNLSLYPRNSSFHSFTEKLNQEICPKDSETIYPLSKPCNLQRIATGELLNSDFPVKFCSGLQDCNQNKENNICHSFEREILQPLETTHVILNTAWHSSLTHCDPHFLPKLIDASDRYFSDPNRYNKKSTNSTLKLAKVLYRSCTTNAKHCSGDQFGKGYLNIEKDRSKYDFFDIHQMTMHLKVFHDLLFNNQLTELLKLVKLSPRWNGTTPTSTLDFIATPLFDRLHFEPWVNTVIHTVFLNSVCSMEGEEEHSKEPWEEETFGHENGTIYYSNIKDYNAAAFAPKKEIVASTGPKAAPAHHHPPPPHPLIPPSHHHSRPVHHPVPPH
jgi:hypothetical protein